MSEKYCPKSISVLTNMLKKYHKPTNNIYTSAWGWSDTVFDIKSKWSIDFECPYPVISSPFRIRTICLNNECYGNIS